MTALAVLAGIAMFAALPGALLLERTKAFRRGRSGAELAGLALALSALLSIASGLLLVRLGLFRPYVVYLTHVAILVGLLALVVWGRRSRPTAWPDWSVLKLGLLPITAAVLIVPVYLSSSAELPASSSAWRYMLDTEQLLDAGEVPDASVQWGVARPFARSKLVGYVWIATVQSLTGMDTLQAMRYLPVFFLGVAFVAAWALLRPRLGAPLTALTTILVFTNYPLNPLMLAKFSRLTVESAGIALLALALLAITSGEVRTKWGSVVAVGLVTAVGLTHGVAFLVLLICLIAYLGTRLLSRHATIRTTATLTLLLLVLPVALVVSGVVTGRGPELSEGLATSDNYKLVDGHGDPTRALSLAIAGRSIHDAPPPVSGFEPPATEYAKWLMPAALSIDTTIGRAVADRYALAYAGLATLLTLAFLARHPNRWLLAGLAAVPVGIFMVAVVFSYQYDLWIFDIHPRRREFAYASLPILLMLAVALVPRPSAATDAGSRALGAESTVALLALGILTTSVYLTTWHDARSWRDAGLSRAEVATLDWIRDSVPPNSLLLTNTRTAGTIELYTGRRSLTEGGVPYLFPDLLDRALTILDDGQNWFEAPSEELLQQYGVTHVVALSQRHEGTALAGNAYARSVDLGQLTAQPYLRELERFDGIAIYKTSVSP